jgi:hypothetical protein
MATQEPPQILAYAVRAKVVLKYLGQLMLLLAALDLLPAAVAFGYGDSELALRFSIVALILVAVSVPWVRVAVPAEIQTNEALVVTALAFLVGAASWSTRSWVSASGYPMRCSRRFPASPPPDLPAWPVWRTSRSPSCSHAPGCNGTAVSAS